MDRFCATAQRAIDNPVCAMHTNDNEASHLFAFCNKSSLLRLRVLVVIIFLSINVNKCLTSSRYVKDQNRKPSSTDSDISQGMGNYYIFVVPLVFVYIYLYNSLTFSASS